MRLLENCFEILENFKYMQLQLITIPLFQSISKISSFSLQSSKRSFRKIRIYSFRFVSFREPEHTDSSAYVCLLYRAVYPAHAVRIKMVAMLQIPWVFPRVSCLESAKAVQCPRPGPKLATKVSKSRAIPPYVPGVNPWDGC